MTFGNILLKFDGRCGTFILYGVERCLNHRHDLSDSSPCSLSSLVCGVPPIAPVMASAALY